MIPKTFLPLKTCFVFCSLLVAVSLLAAPWPAIAADPGTISAVDKKVAQRQNVPSAKAKPFFWWLYGSSLRSGTDGLNSWRTDFSAFTGRRMRAESLAASADYISTETVPALAAAISAGGPQPQVQGETLNVNSTRTVTTDDAYRYVNVGVSAAGTINHSSGTFAVGSTGSTGAGALSLGASSGQTGTYNLSGTGALSVVGDIFVGGGVDGNGGLGAFAQTGGSISVLGNGVTIGTSSGGISTYTISAGTLTSPFILVGDSGPATFTQTGGTVTAGISSIVGGTSFYQDAFSFSDNANGTYQFNGGTLTIPYITTLHDGIGIFNFNGGVLQATTQPAARIFLGADANNSSVQKAIQTANIQGGGAKIDTNGLNITIAQPLVHFAGLGVTLDGGLTKQTGTGTLTLTGANTFTGPTVINAGTLALNNASGALAATSQVTVNTGGTLLLGAANQIKDTAPLTLNANSGPGAGAKVAFNTGGVSETLGALTLSSTSVLDLASGASIVHFASSVQAWTGTLAVWNYSGTARTGGGTDEIFFGTSPSGLTPAQVAQIRFYSDSGTTALAAAGYASMTSGEVVPGGLIAAVPEPATWLGGLGLLGTAGIALRRRSRARLVT